MSVAMETTEQERVSQPGQVAVETVGSSIAPLEGKVTQEDVNQSFDAQPGGQASGEVLEEELKPTGDSQPADEMAGEEQSTEDGQPADGTPDEGQSTKTEQPGDTQGEADPPQPVLSEAEVCLQQGYYIVKPGDSLEKICLKIYGSYEKLEEICRINGIENQNAIYAGQKITLP